MAQARRGGQIQSKLGFLIYGDKGTWKSSLAAQLGDMKNEAGEPMKVLYIDTENGSIDDLLNYKASQGIDVSNIYVVYSTSLEEVKEIVKQAKDCNANKPIMLFDSQTNQNFTLDNEDGTPFIPDAIVIDSLTVLYDSCIDALNQFSKKRAAVRATKKQMSGAEKVVAIEGAGMEIKDYQSLALRGKELILDLMATGKHFVVTTREAEETRSEKNDDGQFVSVKTGKLLPQGFKQVDYNVKTILHTFINEDGEVCAQVESKDRTRVKEQNEIIVNPSLLAWQVIVSGNKDKQEFLVKNSIAESVAQEIKYQEKKTVQTVGESVLDVSDYDTDLDALKTEVGGYITSVKNNPDKTLTKKLGELYAEKGFKEKNPMKYTDKEALKEVRDAIVAWAEDLGITL
ncbi:MAG: AAA family ATPase [Romboutsia timonensis]